MKRIVLFAAISLISQFVFAQNVGIGTSAPNSSAVLDLTGNNKGFLMPRLTSAQRNGILSPAKGLMVYDSSRNDYWYYSGAAWKEIGDFSTNTDSSLIIGQQAGTINSFNLNSSFSLAPSGDSSGIIYDSGGPSGDYGNGEDFIRIIQGPYELLNVYAVDVTVLSNSLENPYDSLIISDYPYRHKYILTGNQTGTYRFSGTVQVEFKSNFTNTNAGFAIRWNRIYMKNNPAASYDSTQLTGWYFNPSKQYVRGGINTANNWSPDSSGVLSFSYGESQAKGTRSFSVGKSNYASGDNSVAMGQSSIASGISAVAMGMSCKATGYGAFSLGVSNTSSATQSVSLGSNNLSSGSESVAIGNSNTSSATTSIAMGTYSDANAYGAVAIGLRNSCSGIYSAALGYSNISRSYGCLTVGYRNDTASAGDANAVNPLNRIFQIGNGPDDATRSNAMTVLHNGNVGIGELNPIAPLNFKQINGNKISLFGTGTNHFGLGTQSGLLQMYAPGSGDDISFGYGNSNSFTENMRVKGTGDALLKGNLSVQNGKGLVRTISSTQEKKLSTSVVVSASFVAGETKTFAVTWPESFSAAPEAYVGNVVSGSGGWAEVVMSISGAGITGATLYIYNPRTTSVSPNFTVKVIAIGAQ